MKNQIMSIFKQAEGKEFTYFQITTALGLHSQPVIENLHIHSDSGDFLQLADFLCNVDQIVNIPFNHIEKIEEIPEEDFEIMDAEAEYRISYTDGSTVYVQIYDRE